MIDVILDSDGPKFDLDEWTLVGIGLRRVFFRISSRIARKADSYAREVSDSEDGSIMRIRSFGFYSWTEKRGTK